MSDNEDHDRRALGVAAAALRHLASDRLYSDAFRHRILASIPNAPPAPAHLQMLLLSTADRLDGIAERMAPPDTPAARLERKRQAKREERAGARKEGPAAPVG